MKTTILYLDDEVVLLDIFKEMFSDEYDVRTASTLSQARSVLSKCPDILIVDWSMPEISGTDFLREAARVCPGSFRILLTGYGQVGDVFSEISSGVIQLFTTKPCDMREVLERATLARSRKRKPRPRPGGGLMALAGFLEILP